MNIVLIFKLLTLNSELGFLAFSVLFSVISGTLMIIYNLIPISNVANEMELNKINYNNKGE
jgi:hypothetical protein